jgi:hypothetical protein
MFSTTINHPFAAPSPITYLGVVVCGGFVTTSHGCEVVVTY